MAKLVDARDSKSCTEKCAGSIPVPGNYLRNLKIQLK